MTDIIGPVKLDAKFLEECGLATLPADEAKLLLRMFYKEMELRVGAALSSGLSDDQLNEFESIIDSDMEMIRSWLDTNFPNFKEEKTYRQLRERAVEGAPEDPILKETASLLWLQVNRPNYRETVNNQLELMRTELMRHKDLLLK